MCSQAPWLTPLICAPADKVQFSWLDSENGLNWCREQRSFHKKSWKLLYKSYKYLILKISLSIFQCLGSHLDKFLPENSLHAFFLNKEIEPSNKKKKKNLTNNCRHYGSYRHYGSMDSWGKGERESLKPYDERYTIKKSVVWPRNHWQQTVKLLMKNQSYFTCYLCYGYYSACSK